MIPVLNHSVHYSWDELKLAAFKKRADDADRKAEEPRVLPAKDDLNMKLSDVKTRAGIIQLSVEQKEALIRGLIPEVTRQVLEELDLVIELTMKNAHSRIRKDIERKVGVMVDAALRNKINETVNKIV